jgi:predicted nucleotidyltransferase
MKLENFSPETLSQQILQIVGKYLPLEKYQLFYFGSRVSGLGSDRSDIDVGIEGPEPVPNQILWQIRHELEELTTLYTIEFVDFNAVSNDFKQVAMAHIEDLRSCLNSKK